MSWALQYSTVKESSRSPTMSDTSSGGMGLNSSHDGSTASLKYDNSNYMNLTNDGLFPGDTMEVNDNNEHRDDMVLSKQGKPPRGRMPGMMIAGDTRSLPNGIAPGSVAKYNMDQRMSPSSQQFLVEHLASFPQDVKAGYLTPAEALTKLKKISSGGGLWAQKMSMNISGEKLVMTNGETMEVIEEYPMQQISLCITVLDDPAFENLLIFSTKLSQDKVGAVHLFQCKQNEASVISEVINKQREQKARLSNGHLNGIPEVISISSSEQSVGPPQPQSQKTRTEFNLQQRHAVARAVEAFQSNAQSPPPQKGVVTEMNGNAVTPIQDAKITRDVEILNKCIEEVENFVVMLKRINEARKQLQLKKRSSKKKKVENILLLQSQPPPEHRIHDVYQKFKHALNLLGKLQPHISDPNAPELIHYLFIPLGIIVKVTSIEKARAVVDPLLTATCVNLLVNCLDSREYHFWQSLGPNWTLTRMADQFKDRYFNPYIPVFVDGWIPPEAIANEKHEAVVKTTSAMVARMKVRTSSIDQMNKSTVVLAAMKFKELAQRAQEQKQGMTRSESSSGILQLNTAEMTSNQPLRNNSFSETQRTYHRLIGIVVYDYLAHNNKELTIRAGEKVFILDNSRRWWLVRNDHGEEGYVPSTVLEIPTQDSGASSPIDSTDSLQTSPRSVTNNGHIQSTSYSPSYDANGNYVNENSFPTTTNTQPTKTITPVVISVQLPDGSSVQSNADGTHIIATPASINNAQQRMNSISMQTNTAAVQRNNGAASPPDEPSYAVVKKKQVSAQTSNDYNATPQYQQTQIVNQAQIMQQHQQRHSPPRTAAPPPQFEIPGPPAPPPPPVPPTLPPVSPKPNSIMVSKEANFQSIQNGGGTPSNYNPGEAKGVDLHSELRDRLTLQQVEVGHANETVPNIDAVDVFIPLYKSSTADDVSRWLLKLGFSQRTVDMLKGKTALDLFKIDKEDMIDLLGNDEGIQLFEELQVQNGAQSRHKTLTEFQRALVKRLQKRENQQEIAREDTTRFQNQSMVKKQKEELEKLKSNSREPGSATFTSFSAINTPQGKTRL